MGRSLMSCKDVSLLISLGEDQRLTVRERMMLRIHLFFCEACSRFKTQVRFVDKAMTEYLRGQSGPKKEAPVLSEEARNRIRRAMDEGSRE